MLIEIDFNSDEAIYVQLQHQIIMGIATEVLHEGDTLPSVRQLADTVGINMHTVNKAYSILKQQRGSFALLLPKAAVKISAGRKCMSWWMNCLTNTHLGNRIDIRRERSEQ